MAASFAGISWPRFVCGRVFSSADTTTIRLMMANGSILAAAALLIDNHAFQRPVFALQKWFGTEHVWAAYFTLHAFGVYWRIFDRVPRLGWALAINFYGLALWIVATASTNAAVGEFTATTAMEWSMCLAAFWALCVTGLKDEVVSP